MTYSLLLPLAVVLPLLGAFLLYLFPADTKQAIRLMVAVTAVEFVLLIFVLSLRFANKELTFVLDGFCGLTLKMRSDGFRALYAAVAGLMWCATSVFSRDYMRHAHSVRRYCFFILLTQAATVGLLLSDCLATAFLFFEVMSLASYPWVAQEEEPQAMRAAETYLYVAVIGGLVMLMGLLLLPQTVLLASFTEISTVLAAADRSALMLPAILVFVGFGAKAGAFPLHIWLPKAHPVAPAPASALLSGLLTKAGIFGVLVLACQVMRGYMPFAELIFWLGVVTMFLGALLAVFAVNLKKTLACSSLSQIGFILVGIGTLSLCHGENALSAWGVVGHMVNHSLLKLLLFLCAGVVAMNAHALELNDIRGYGRKKPLLHAVFLIGLLGISGIPGLNGFISKSLLHEGLLEWIAEAETAMPYRVAEWIFIVSGGMTLCYMLKLYICLFWNRNPDAEKQAEYEANRKYLSKPSKAVLVITALMLAAIGLLPSLVVNTIGEMSSAFLGSPLPAHTPAYFCEENIVGALKSIVIGLLLFAACNYTLFGRESDGSISYPNRWPNWLDLENGLYRPLLRTLKHIGALFARLFAMGPEIYFHALKAIGGFAAHAANLVGDGLAYLLSKFMLPARQIKEEPMVGNRASWSIGRMADKLVTSYTRGRVKPQYEITLAADWQEAKHELRETFASISFSQIMFAFGLVCVLVVVVLWR